MSTRYTAIIDYVDDEVACECDNCDWVGSFVELVDIHECVLTPGDPSPAGRCPLCSALAYLSPVWPIRKE